MCSFRVQPLWSVARRCLLLAVVWWSLAAAPAAVAQIYFGGAGPDAFGHMGNDSLFNLRDISTTGQLLSLGDDETVNRSLGFNFSYYGTVFSSVNVSSNGFLSFTNSSDGCCDSQPLPTSASWPENMIAGAWTDLDPTEGGQIRVQTLGTPGSREFVVGYYDVQHNLDILDAPTPSSFEIILHEGSNNIEFQYDDLLQNEFSGFDSDRISIGIQNATRTDALQAAFFPSATSTMTTDTLRAANQGYMITTRTNLGTLNEGRRSPDDQPLIAGEVRWFRFDLPQAVDEVDDRFLTIDTVGSVLTNPSNDTEIGLYRADGTLVANDDDDGPDLLSRLAFGDGDGNLPAGQYYLAASAFSTTHNATDFDVRSLSGRTGDISVNFLYGTDLGTLSEVRRSPTDQSLAANQVRWYRLNLPDGVDQTDNRFLLIDTLGSTLSTDNDTEIGLYRADGTRVSSDDDSGPARLSRLDFAADDGALPAGQYYLAASGFNTTFNATNFDVASSSSYTGNVSVNLLYGTDVGTLDPGTTPTASQALGSQEIQWYRIELANSIEAANGQSLVIDTTGSILTDIGNGPDDTEIGLYDADGNLIDSDDDGGTDRLSRLAFGSAASSSGDLSPGTYFLAATAFSTTHLSTDFGVTSTSTSTGSIVLNFAMIALPGDYNGDGMVDAADYIVWRKNEGTSNVLLNDPIGGPIGMAHYNQWRDHFGQTPAGSGSGSLAAVPEPASALLLAVMAMLLPLARVQRR